MEATKMPVMDQLREALSDLSKSERRAAEYLLQYPHDVRRFSCDAIAKSCNTSRSAVIRLCKKLGYHGYSELRYAMITDPGSSLGGEGKGQEKTVMALDCYGACIEQMRPMANTDKISRIAEILLHANRVITMGIGHSSFSAMQMAFRLNRMHIDSHAIDDTSVMNNYAGILKQGDVVLIFSISGNDAYLDYVKQYRQNRAAVVLFTMTPQSVLARGLEHVCALPLASHYNSSYLMDDAITFFLAIEMVMEELNRKLVSEACPVDETGRS
ncbi:MAG: MurR/RpiR family transcriptional regulator [Lachnospiraceae bacterium]|nr:MurR/RpiR family transcriptional regulator [Lachnospiraceae bacterium]